MKRLSVPLAIVIVATTVLACTCTRAQIAPIPHEDPDRADSLIETASYLMHFPEIPAFISVAEGESLTEVVEASKYDYVVKDIRYVVERFQSLVPMMEEDLDSLAEDLVVAAFLLEGRQTEDCFEKLRQAQKDINKQEQLLQALDEHAKDLEELSQQAKGLASRFGRLTDVQPALSKVQELSDEAQRMLDRLEGIRDRHGCLEEALKNLPTETSIRQLEAPTEAYSGFRLAVTGSLDGELPRDRKVEISLDDDVLAQGISDTQGHFEFEIQVESNMPPGKHTLTVEVLPKALNAGASEERPLHVMTRASCLIDVRMPARIMLPTTIDVEGRVSSALGPVPEARVTLTLGKASSVVETSKEGRFKTRLELPLDLGLVGSQDLIAEVEPANAWLPAHAKTSILIMNPVHMGLVTAGFVAAAVVAYRRLAGRRGGEVTIMESEPSLEMLAELAPRLEPHARVEGITGRILAAYLKAMRLVEGLAAVSMKPNQTLREFLIDSKAALKGGAEAFSELTRTTERALYSHYTIDAEEATRAEGLATRVEEALKGGAA